MVSAACHHTAAVLRHPPPRPSSRSRRSNRGGGGERSSGAATERRAATAGSVRERVSHGGFVGHKILDKCRLVHALKVGQASIHNVYPQLQGAGRAAEARSLVEGLLVRYPDNRTVKENLAGLPSPQ
jgi:hypothetical protein